MRFRITLLLIGLVVSAACTKTGTPTPAPATSAPAAPTVAPTVAPVVPTTAPAPTQQPAPKALPRPLYFIGPTNTVNQVWRLGTDGVTLAQISHEQAEVINFDVSPADGSIAFVSSNKLIKVDANGGNRVELFTGPAINPTPGPDQINTQVSSVHWKPDGTLIAYALNGVNTIAANGGAPIIVQANDPIPSPSPTSPARFFWPAAWSPDGSRILMNVSFYPEGGSLAVKIVAGGAPIMFNTPEGWPCCNPDWSLDSSAIFFANDYPGLIPAGLWRVDAASGLGSTLIEGANQTGTAFNLVSQVKQLSDQRLYYFIAHANAMPDNQPAVSMTSSTVDGNTDRKQLRTDSYVIGEALWDPNQTGAVIKDLTGAPLDFSGGQSTQLIWLNVNNTVPLKLPAFGFNLRWGKP
jgi:hypothetical protein